MQNGVPKHLKPYLEVENEVVDENEEFIVKGKVRCTCGCDTFTIYREKWVLPVEAKEAFKEINELYEKHKKNPKLNGRLSFGYTKGRAYITVYDTSLHQHIFLEDITELNKKASKVPKMPTYVEAVCSHCGKEIVIFNSSRDGYDGVIDEDKQDKGSFPIIKKRRCRICKEEVYKMEVTISSTGKTDLFTEVDDRSIINEETWENAFDWITIDLECGKCGKKTKKYLDLETM